MGINFGRNKYDFSELLKGLQQAVNSAQQLLEVQQLNAIGRFFDASGKALTKPICASNGVIMDVPIIALVPQNTLIMESVEIEFDAKLAEVSEAKLTNDELKSAISNTQVQLGIAGKKEEGVVHVKVIFKSTEVPEGVCKLIDECNKQF